MAVARLLHYFSGSKNRLTVRLMIRKTERRAEKGCLFYLVFLQFFPRSIRLFCSPERMICR